MARLHIQVCLPPSHTMYVNLGVGEMTVVRNYKSLGVFIGTRSRRINCLINTY